MKIELERIQLEIEAATHAHITPNTGDIRVTANKLQLPTFDEKCDELDAYFEKFERFAVS